MSDTGTIVWIDLTAENAEQLRDFYHEVVGWQPSPVDMGEYNDFVMNRPGSGDAAAGVCHARGPNADLPAQWLVYISVGDLDQSMAQCRELGGKVIAGPNSLGEHGRFCVIRDPAGAVAALIEQSR